MTTTARIDYRTVDVTLAADTAGATMTIGEHTGSRAAYAPLPIGSRCDDLGR